MPKRCSDAQLEAAWAARETRPDLSTFESDEAKHEAMAAWVESWGGAALTNTARRATWWKQSKKQHGELVAKQRARLEQLGELGGEAPAAAAAAAAVTSFDGAPSTADDAASQALTALVAIASSADDASAIALVPTAASDAAASSSVVTFPSPNQQPRRSIAETATSQALAEAAPSQQPPSITADTAASQAFATVDPCSAAALVPTASDAAVSSSSAAAAAAAAVPSRQPAPYNLRRPLQPGALWINRNAPHVSKLTAPPAVPTPTGRHAVRTLSAAVKTPSGAHTEVQEGEVRYSLPPLEGERESAAQRREKRHRDREEVAIRSFQLRAAQDTVRAAVTGSSIAVGSIPAVSSTPAVSSAIAVSSSASALGAAVDATGAAATAPPVPELTATGLPKLPRQPAHVADPEEDARRQAAHAAAYAQAKERRVVHKEAMTELHALQKATRREEQKGAREVLEGLQERRPRYRACPNGALNSAKQLCKVSVLPPPRGDGSRGNGMQEEIVAIAGSWEAAGLPLRSDVTTAQLIESVDDVYIRHCMPPQPWPAKWPSTWWTANRLCAHDEVLLFYLRRHRPPRRRIHKTPEELNAMVPAEKRAWARAVRSDPEEEADKAWHRSRRSLLAEAVRMRFPASSAAEEEQRAHWLAEREREARWCRAETRRWTLMLHQGPLEHHFLLGNWSRELSREKVDLSEQAILDWTTDVSDLPAVLRWMLFQEHGQTLCLPVSYMLDHTTEHAQACMRVERERPRLEVLERQAEARAKVWAKQQRERERMRRERQMAQYLGLRYYSAEKSAPDADSDSVDPEELEELGEMLVGV